MRAETLTGAVGLAGLMLAVLAALPSAPQLPRFNAANASSAPPARPVRALRVGAHNGAPVVLALDAEIARLGRAPVRLDPLRRAFLDSRNLMQFALDRVSRAAAGDGASQYFIYLALDQCRSYLRSDFDSARANLESLEATPDLTSEERLAWLSEYERCRGFSAGDWSALGDALGEERPGAEIEYASVWFEWAAQSGYGPALAEQALRPSPYGADERAAMLREALPSRDPDVYWLLFAHSGQVQSGEINAPALAWLIVACRAGQDCSESARWYRGFICTQEEHRCEAGQSAVEYYWSTASPLQRDQAWTQALEIEANIRAGRWNRLPLPELESLDSSALWGKLEN